MLGRLLSHAFTPPRDGSTSPSDVNGGNSGSFKTRSPRLAGGDGFNRPENDDEIHPTFPVSFLEEADTRNLLYGQSFSQTGRLSSDILKDIRVVVICDSPCIEGSIYDSARETNSNSNVSVNTTTGTRSSPLDNGRNSTNSPSLMVSTLSRVSALTRSFSSTALNTSVIDITGSGAGIPTPAKTLNRPNTIASSLSPVGRSPTINSTTNTPHHRRTSSTTSSANPSSNSALPSHEIAPMLQLTLLKEIVFGYSAMRFHGQLTKIHPLPKSKSNADKRPWIVSRIFKIGVDDSNFNSMERANITSSTTSTRLDCAPKHLTTSTSSTISHSTISSNTTSSSIEDDNIETEELPTWKPKSNATGPPLSSHAKDVRCAICISFNLPPESEDAITNHWTELSYALADLQATIYRKLQIQLPKLILESRIRKPSLPATNAGTSSGNGAYHYNYRSNPRAIYKIDGDLEIKNAVEFFKTRFSTALRIPRVLCGQDNWPDLFREMRWASMKWENASDGGFLAAMIVAYIEFNSGLLEGKLHEDDDIPRRTVILANNRIIARKLIFILSSFIRSQTSERIRKRMNLSNSLNNAFVKSHGQRSSSVSTTTSVSSSPLSRASTKFSFVDGGWEISQSQSMIEPTGTVAIPHVVRPSFSSASLAESIGISSSSDSSRGGGLFSSFRNSDARLPESPSTYYDDYYFNEQLANADRDMAYSLPAHHMIGDTKNGTVTPACARPSLSRCHSSERSATTLNSINHRMYDRQRLGDMVTQNLYHRTVVHNTSDSDLTNSSDDAHYLTATSPNYRLVNDEEEQFVLDVSEPTTPVHSYDESRPIVLPRVAGHISSFHPDFILQACPITRDLEEKISGTMIRDGEVNPISVAVKNKITNNESSRELLSKTLIINLRKRELSTYGLVATSDDSSKVNQRMVREIIFSNYRPVDEYTERVAKLSEKILDILEDEGDLPSPSRGTHLDDLIKAYETFFGLL